MQLGLSTYTYTWSIGVPGSIPEHPLTALDLLDRAHSLGVGLVQMADNLPLEGMSPGELDAFEARARQQAVRIEVGTRGIAPDHLRRCLALAVRFASPILRVVIDTPDHQPAPQEAAGLLAPLGPEFERAGVTLAIENHDRFPAAVLAGLVRSLGGWAGVCLDTVNSFGALEGPREVIAALAPLTVNLHVKDFTIFRASHKMGFSIEGRPAGQGKLDLPALLDELDRYGRTRSAILELWTPPAGTIAETVDREQHWAEESVAYLQDCFSKTRRGEGAHP